MSFLIRISNS